MKKLIVIIGFLGFAYQASSCSCIYLKHFMKTLKYSEYAIIGQLVAITEIDSVPPFDKVGVKGKFKIQQVLKGKIETSEIEIIGGIGIDCREDLFSLNLYTDYVVLLNYDFSLSVCGYTYLPLENEIVHGRIDRKKEQIMPLGQLIKKINKKTVVIL
jgi:hypothetical protein